jgi:hypothetical protein
VPTWVSETVDRRVAGLRCLEVDLADGRVEIGSRAGHDVRVRVTVGTRGWRARLARRIAWFRPHVPPLTHEGDTLRLSSARARTRVQVDVPDTVRVVAAVADGDITMWGPAAELDLRVEKGAIAARDLRSPVVAAENGDGEVTLHFTERPRTVTARSASGPVRLVVPPGPYAVDAPDEAAVTVTPDADADAAITVRSGGGTAVLAAVGSAPI